MSAQAKIPPTAADAALEVDQLHPWLGLASFTEETRSFFYGREDEVAELARRVQRKLLTVLFGQSGLGKTSILRAGLVPRLRSQGYCPVYVRIAYGHDSPLPSEQIKQAIFRYARLSGQWTQQGVAVEGESLWEFLHHRDDVLRDETGATLIPLLIFDQFEEIFTLGQTDDFGRQRAAQFIADLSDLVENRPPKALEAKLEEDDQAADRFDFTRSDYRVLIALREDYLAHLEGLKGVMPSITQNRMRLARMTGQQALAAVTGPGGRLVSEEVAEAIVRFVAGGAELANAEVEPSLLSLICRELNDTRIEQGRSEISVDLLDGSQAGILGEFYERALADQPAAVRQLIEDELLTESGYRENVAEERVLRSFEAAGAAPDALAVLVNRRLLRIEERLDVRRVELTHDVLCDVVRHSRDLRHEREAREATDRLLAEQRARELAARRALVRARQVAIGCAVLAICAVGAAVYGYMSTERARRAERLAEETRALAERGRGDAERLIAYLVDDFALELEGVGRVGVVGELSKKEIDYYKSLPPALQNDDARRSAALAMVRYGSSLRLQARPEQAQAALTDAVAALEKLRQTGDTSESTSVGLALGLSEQAAVADTQLDINHALPLAERAAKLLQPVADAPDSSVSARRAYGKVMIRLGIEQSRGLGKEIRTQSVETLETAKQAFTGIGGLDLSDLPAAAGFAEAVAWQVDSLKELGRGEEARRAGAEGEAVVSKLLDRRPGHMAALRSLSLITNNLAGVANDEMHLAEALSLGERSEAALTQLTRLDPANVSAWINLAVARNGLADTAWGLGRPAGAAAFMHKATELPPHRIGQNAKFLMWGVTGAASRVAGIEADLGHRAASQAALELHGQYRALLVAADAPGSAAVAETDCWNNWNRTFTEFVDAGPAASRDLARKAIAAEQARAVHDHQDELLRRECIIGMAEMQAFDEYLLRDYSGAERTTRAAIGLRRQDPLDTTGDQRQDSRLGVMLAMTLAREGNRAAAEQAIAPALALQRTLAARNHDDASQRLELATALYAAALADPTQRAALLHEAAALMAALPQPMQTLHSVAPWRDLISAELRGGAAAAQLDAAGPINGG
ncbi:MAG TPA: hypothetical protein VN790_02550 [Steroidobacteraceae bacterium]|nr:hypothetical protein [Steroidobacteraceae bacterium]